MVHARYAVFFGRPRFLAGGFAASSSASSSSSSSSAAALDAGLALDDGFAPDDVGFPDEPAVEAGFALVALLGGRPLGRFAGCSPSGTAGFSFGGRPRFLFSPVLGSTEADVPVPAAPSFFGLFLEPLGRPRPRLAAGAGAESAAPESFAGLTASSRSDIGPADSDGKKRGNSTGT